MKLTDRQLEYIRSERNRMQKRLQDLNSFGEDLYKSEALSREKMLISYDLWFFRHILKLNSIEVSEEF